MEQNLLVQHSSGKNYKPKGFNGRKALQVALLLAVSIWLLYQMMHSHDKHKNYGGNTHNKLNKELETILLGRRGKVGFEAKVDFEDGNALEEDLVREGEGVGEFEFDTIIEIKAEEIRHERQYKEVPSNGTEATATFMDSAEDSFTKVLEGEEEMESKEDNANTQVIEENEENENTQKEDEKESFVKEEDVESERGEEKIDFQDSEAKSTSNPGQGDMEYGVHGFHDENGVPPDGLDPVNSTPYDPRGDDNIESLHHETLLSSNDQSSFTENRVLSYQEFVDSSQSNTILRREKVEFQEQSNIYNVEIERKSTLEGLKIL